MESHERNLGGADEVLERHSALPCSAGLLQSALMPAATLIIVLGSWVLLALLAVVAYRFNRRRGGD